MIKVNIISGFLGAGKTTLIKKLLADAMKDEKVILLENEYGEVGVDGGFMKDSGVTVTELNSGCICCTLAGDFQKAISELIDTYHPDRLLVEPTGVGKLSEIRNAVEEAREHHPELKITGCATVVDAGRCRMYMKNFGEFFIDQIKSAETVIFSRTQLLSADRVEKSRALVAEQNPAARIITTPWDDLDAHTMLETIEQATATLLSEEDIHEAHHHDHDDDCHCHEHEHEHEHHHDHDDECHCHEHEHEHHHDHDDDCHCHEHEHEHHHDHDDDCHCHEHEHHHDHDGKCSCGHEHHHHHHGHDADEVFDNIGVETAKRFTEEGLRDALSKLEDEEEYGAILRAKGILQAEDGRWLHFDYVPGEAEIRYGSADYTGRMCVIGTHIDEAALRALFGV